MHPHIVDPDDPGAALVRSDRGADRGCGRPDRGRSVAEEPRERALAREADDERPPERGKLRKPAGKLEVVLDRLPESDPGIEADVVLGIPSETANASRSSRNDFTSETTSSYRGSTCIVRGSPFMCMRQQ